MSVFVPKRFELVKGKGLAKHPLVAFHRALMDAGIGDFNLVKVSSVLPAGCVETKGLKNEFKRGSIVHCVMSTFLSNQSQYTIDGTTYVNATAAAAVAYCVGEDGGYVVEFSDVNITKDVALKKAKDLASQLFDYLPDNYTYGGISIDGELPNDGSYLCLVAALIFD